MLIIFLKIQCAKRKHKTHTSEAKVVGQSASFISEVTIIIIIIIIRQELDLDRPVSASFYSLFRGLPRSSKVFQVAFVHFINNSSLFFASCCCLFLLHVVGLKFIYYVSVSYPNIFCLFLSIILLWCCGPTRAMASSFLKFLDHTQRRTTVGRTPLDE